MTDVATRTDSGDAPETGASSTVPAIDAGAPTTAYEWAQPEPEPKKKKRLLLWIGIPATVAVVGLVASSLVLIAPGTAVAGVAVGGLTAGAAADAIQARLSETTLVLTGDADDVEVTGAELGATVDAQALAEDAFSQHPMWNPTQWFATPDAATITLDASDATAALREAAPSLYVDPVPAGLAFDPATATYTVTPAQPGQGIDVAAVQVALQDAFVSGQTRVDLDAQTAAVDSPTTTAVAEAAAGQLNAMLDTVGFYVGAERTVPVDRTVAASWITVSIDDDGAFVYAVDSSSVQAVVDTLPAVVNRAAVNATVITNTDGASLEALTEGVVGREVGATDGMAAAMADQMVAGNAVYTLPVTEVPFATTTLERRIEVDLGAQTTYLFENGQVVNSFAISSGLAGTPTPTGNFKVFAHVRQQNMGCYEGATYCTKDVPWVAYFAPDIAFHGAYWHNNFGQQMSHGCVNLPVSTAKYVYDWAVTGTEVWVHS